MYFCKCGEIGGDKFPVKPENEGNVVCEIEDGKLVEF